MADKPTLLDQFAPTRKSNFAPAETVAIQVTGYVIPNGGLLENSSNARIQGHRWDNGEPVEVAFRKTNGDNERPKIAQFQNDAGSNTPVTTAIGGTLIFEAAFPDPNLAPLRDNTKTVLSARWATRISADNQQGWAVPCLARVNPPRLMDEYNPDRGYYQTISLMQPDTAQRISSIEQLDTTILDALDTDLRDRSPYPHTRPGSVSAYVRITHNDESRMVTLSAGFYKPAGAAWDVPKPRNLVFQDRLNDTAWQEKRKVCIEAINNPAFEVEVISGSQIFVGKTTLKSALASKNAITRIHGMTLEQDDKVHNLFSPSIIGIRKSTKTGQPQALFVAPKFKEQVASLTGRPTQADHDRYAASVDSSEPASPKPAAAAPVRSAQVAAPVATPVAAPVAEPVAAAPIQVSPATAARAEPVPTNTAQTEPQKLVVQRPYESAAELIVHAQTPEQAAFLQAMATKLTGTFDVASRSLVIADSQFPALMMAAQKQQLVIEVIAPSPTAAPVVTPARAATATVTPAIEPAMTPTPQPTIAQSAPAAAPSVAAPVNEPPAYVTEDIGVNLDQLDLAGIDLDAALSEAMEYEETMQNSRS